VAAASTTTRKVSAGQVLGAGYSYYGELGVGDTSSRYTPTAVSGLSSVSIVAFSTKDCHTLLICEIGEAREMRFFSEVIRGEQMRKTRIGGQYVSCKMRSIPARPASSKWDSPAECAEPWEQQRWYSIFGREHRTNRDRGKTERERERETEERRQGENERESECVCVCVNV
jgi:hypothetical protein